MPFPDLSDIPDAFVWGAASAAYQIEGAHDVDGKGPSIWDAYCQRDGTIKDSSSGKVACDHYHRYEDDIALFADLNLEAYRFSLSWSRILPEGVGTVNGKGLDFYDKLVDCMLAKGIKPWATLYHWDLPLTLQQRGGWLNPAIVDWFGAYAEVVMDRLGDRVHNWFTLNEPQVFLGLGMRLGEQAPGMKISIQEGISAVYHVLLAHDRAAGVIRQQGAKVGVAFCGEVCIPARPDDPVCVQAARRRQFSMPRAQLGDHPLYSEPLFKGHFPHDGWSKMNVNIPHQWHDHLAVLPKTPPDFYGMNCYSGTVVDVDADGNPVPQIPRYDRAMTSMGWPLHFDTLYWAAKHFHERYHVPIVISENGMSGTDWVHVDGRVSDPARQDLMHRLLAGLGKAGNEGAELAGYFHWSIMDNFEWSEGYGPRFGLIHVDYDTLVRTPKESAYWYRDMIAQFRGR